MKLTADQHFNERLARMFIDCDSECDTTFSVLQGAWFQLVPGRLTYGLESLQWSECRGGGRAP